MIGRAIGRLIVIPFGLIVAAAAAAFVLVTWGLESLTMLMHGLDFEPQSVDRVFDIVERGSGLAAGATLLPAIAVVVVGEVARIRSALYYVVAGGAALAAIPLLGGLADKSGQGSSSLWLVFATAGFAAGLVYWLIAGRNA